MSKMHDRWMSESRGKEAYTEWLEKAYIKLNVETKKLKKEKKDTRLWVHRTWLTINQPESK